MGLQWFHSVHAAAKNVCCFLLCHKAHLEEMLLLAKLSNL